MTRSTFPELRDADEAENSVRDALTLESGTAGGRDDVAHGLSELRRSAALVDGPEAEELENTVRDALTLESAPCPLCNRRFRDRVRTSKEAALGAHVLEAHADFKPPRPKRPSRTVETMEYLSAARRFIRKAGARVGDSDEYELAELVGLRTELELAIRTAIGGQRGRGRSWAHIGDALGITRQSAQERYGKA